MGGGGVVVVCLAKSRYGMQTVLMVRRYFIGGTGSRIRLILYCNLSKLLLCYLKMFVLVYNCRRAMLAKSIRMVHIVSS